MVSANIFFTFLRDKLRPLEAMYFAIGFSIKIGFLYWYTYKIKQEGTESLNWIRHREDFSNTYVHIGYHSGHNQRL